MTEPLTFVLACEVIDNVRLMKPHGMIPYTMHRHHGYNAEVVTYRHGEYRYLQREVKGLRGRFLRRFLSGKSILPFFLFLARHAREIDVLMVYNIKKRPIYYGLAYKLFNPRGFLYAKADTSQTTFGFYVENAFWPYRVYMRALGRLFLRVCNAVSVETREVYQGNTQVPKDKLLLMPCGFDPELPARLGVRRRQFQEKENIILHVARMGVPAKNSEQLLDALAAMDLPADWKVVFAGAQTEPFKQRCRRFMEKHPEKAAQVEFHEHIEDKALLFDLYSRAKIFCLPSVRETFGNAMVEAEYFGNAIVGSEHLPSVRDLVDHGRAGVTFSVENPDALVETLSALVADPRRLRRLCEGAQRYASANLVWSEVVAPLDAKIKSHYGAREALEKVSQ